MKLVSKEIFNLKSLQLKFLIQLKMNDFLKKQKNNKI